MSERIESLIGIPARVAHGIYHTLKRRRNELRSIGRKRDASQNQELARLEQWAAWYGVDDAG